MGRGQGLRGSRSSRCITSDKLRLDVRYLRRHRLLGFGRNSSLSWGMGEAASAAIGIQSGLCEEPECLWLRYRWTPYGYEPRDMVERVQLVWTECNYGGARPWFACPGCERRVAILWGSPFLCRRCHDLAYASQRENDTDRAISRSLRIRAKLGLRTNLEQPMFKPNRMRQRTWQRLLAELAASDATWIGATMKRLTMDRSAH